MPRHPRVAPVVASLSHDVYSALAARARERPGPVHPLHVGDTWLDPLPAARAEAQRADAHPRLHGYAPVQGEPALLAAILRRLASRHGVEVDPACLQVMPGATTGLAIVVGALLSPGDELVVPSPFWPLIRGIAISHGCTSVEVPFFTRFAEPGFDPEAALERAIGPRTAAIYVNAPNNPTGRLLPDAVAEAIAAVARRHDLWVIADEAYEDLVHAGEHRPLWRRPDLAGRTVVTHTLSKSHALAGARIGYTHGPPEAMRAIRALQFHESYCAARPMQFAAAAALDGGDAWLAEARAAYAAAGRAAAAAVGIPPPEAGTFLFFDAAKAFAPGEGLPGFLERCLEAGVLLTPGPACGRDYESWVRLCFTAVPPDALADALARLSAVLGR
ncbi:MULTISPECIES: pyridoxal phosphate-dependent aminotransferase [Anaeromyxobacter]|uniref:pyridoxal phosphate-dependent aminotransferase n=1 Tax=Anaeromyxobacter TaxID=161492 RepID=UPI001F56A113|nr:MULTISPECIES: pyridoxal phosphate-dependent aminotransferase [unclassified Anaeromyxobacter]